MTQRVEHDPPLEQELEHLDGQIRMLLVENKRLREALEPFAKCCEQIADNESDEEWAKFRLLIKDYRAAHSALFFERG